MSMHYQRLLKILEKWPLDKLKSGRDLGEQIRQHIHLIRNQSKLASHEYDSYSKQFDSLERLVNNVYGRKYNRIHGFTATGLTAQQCSLVLSSEFLQYLKDK